MITFGNYGNGLAPKASVSLNLPEGLSLVSADPPPARSSNSDKFRGGVLEWDAGDLPVGETRRIKCTVHVISVPERGSLVMATASAVGTDIDPSNNVAYARRYAQRGARGSHPLAAPGPPRRPLFLWIVIIAVVVGILVLVLRRTRHRS